MAWWICRRRGLVMQRERQDLLNALALLGREATSVELADASGTSRKGAGQRLNAMKDAGLVAGTWDPEKRVWRYSLSDAGRALTTITPGDQLSSVLRDVTGAEIVRRAVLEAFDEGTKVLNTNPDFYGLAPTLRAEFDAALVTKFGLVSTDG